MIELIIFAVLLALSAWKSREFMRIGVKGMCAAAILTALASVGRALLAGIPSVQPSSFIIMVCGATLGGGAGLYCGMLTAVLSNLLIGQIGPYTVWQMFFWGVMGLMALKPMNAGPVVRVIYGFAWGFIFGWGMNLWYPLAGFVPLNAASFLMACVSSFTFDLAHAVTNAALCLAAGGASMKVVKRFIPESSAK